MHSLLQSTSEIGFFASSDNFCTDLGSFWNILCHKVLDKRRVTLSVSHQFLNYFNNYTKERTKRDEAIALRFGATVQQKQNCVRAHSADTHA